MNLFRMIYFSENHLEYDAGKVEAQLESILQISQANNMRDGVTGALIFDDLWFIQILEGYRETVWRTYDRIRVDERHHRATIVDARKVEDREFASWTMALIRRNNSTSSVFNEYSSGQRMNVETMSVEDFISVLRRTVLTARK